MQINYETATPAECALFKALGNDIVKSNLVSLRYAWFVTILSGLILYSLSRHYHLMFDEHEMIMGALMTCMFVSFIIGVSMIDAILKGRTLRHQDQKIVLQGLFCQSPENEADEWQFRIDKRDIILHTAARPEFASVVSQLKSLTNHEPVYIQATGLDGFILAVQKQN